MVNGEWSIVNEEKNIYWPFFMGLGHHPCVALLYGLIIWQQIQQNAKAQTCYKRTRVRRKDDE